MPAHQARNGTRYGAATAVQAAPRPIATPATAPVNSPSVAACAMPWPCEIVPSARPRATGCVIRQRSISQGPNAAPIIPVVTTKSAVSAGLALIALATSTAIGTVADLIDIEDVSSGVNAKACAIRPALIIVPSEPATRPQLAGSRLRKKIWRFL